MVEGQTLASIGQQAHAIKAFEAGLKQIEPYPCALSETLADGQRVAEAGLAQESATLAVIAEARGHMEAAEFAVAITLLEAAVQQVESTSGPAVPRQLSQLHGVLDSAHASQQAVLRVRQLSDEAERLATLYDFEAACAVLEEALACDSYDANLNTAVEN